MENLAFFLCFLCQSYKGEAGVTKGQTTNIIDRPSMSLPGTCVLEPQMIPNKYEFYVIHVSQKATLSFCESVHTDPHKNATKTEVFENAVKSGYPQKTEVFENAFDQYERTKTEVFENAPIANNELHKNGAM